MWPVVAIAAISVGTIWLLYFVYRSPHRSDLEAFIALTISVGTVAAAWIAWAWKARIRQGGEAGGAAELDQLSNLLAGTVQDQWTRAAADRGLLEPEPIPVVWRKPSRPIAGPVSAAVGSKRFPPLPGLSAVGQQRLRAGQIGDLHAVYGGLGSGRLVIVGDPGAGKSGAAVLLILAALKHRNEVPGDDRPRVPVPVMFTLHGWDPNRQRIHDWIATKLQQTYPLLASKSGAGQAAALLSEGKVSVFLDGLDEIPGELRPDALRALSQQATFRLIILARTDEMAEAVSHGLLEGAAALELQDIDAVTAAGYLTRVQLDPAPRGWRELTGRLRRTPDSSIAQALNSPLTLTLVRDTYRSGDDIRELLDFCDDADRRVSPEDIVGHLLDRVLPAAYAQRPGHPPPRYDLHTAQHALHCLATRMNRDGTRDLLWWRLHEWAPGTVRIIATGLVFGLLTGLAVGLGAGLLAGLWAGLFVGVMFGLPVRFHGEPQYVAPVRWRRLFCPPLLWYVLTTGLLAGLAAGLAVGLAAGPTVGLVLGLGVGLVFGLAGGVTGALRGAFSRPGADVAKSLGPLSPLTSWRSQRAAGLMVGLTYGLAAGLALGLAAGLPAGLATGLAGGLTFGLAFGLAVEPPAGLTVGLLAGLAVGCAAGFVLGLGSRPASALAVRLAVGVAGGLIDGGIIGSVGGLMYTSTWSASLTFAQLAARWHTPVRLMRFLEDARERNVLRTVGPVYQFRHGRLQDRLADQAFAASRNLGKPARGAELQGR